MFQNIIWDVDGTLFDTYPAIARAFRAALNDLGQDASLDWIETLAKKSLGYCVSTLAEQYHLEEKDLGQAFDEHYDRAKPAEQPAFPGVQTVCEYICSLGGKNIIVTHRGKESTQELLAANHITPYFSGLISRDDGYPKKPHPAAFEAALQKQNLRCSETLTVGDRDIDMLAGQAAGVFTCLFGAELESVKADLTISNFDELYSYLVSQRD